MEPLAGRSEIGSPRITMKMPATPWMHTEVKTKMTMKAWVKGLKERAPDRWAAPRSPTKMLTCLEKRAGMAWEVERREWSKKESSQAQISIKALWTSNHPQTCRTKSIHYVHRRSGFNLTREMRRMELYAHIACSPKLWRTRAPSTAIVIASVPSTRNAKTNFSPKKNQSQGRIRKVLWMPLLPQGSKRNSQMATGNVKTAQRILPSVSAARIRV